MVNSAPQKSPENPAILKSVAALRTFVSQARSGRGTIALVPTMGALHDGHMALVREGLKKADSCIVSIFVNPTQFGPNEDLAAYPRTWDADIAKLTAAGVQGVFYPDAREMYPEGFDTTIKIGGVTETLEGEHRPGHFEGVATVVAKLLLQALPDIALFGEKDYQQLLLVKKLVADLNIPVEIIGVSTQRDENGLALSSRNAYLGKDQYEIAVSLNKILFAAADKIAAGDSNFAALEEWAEAQLLKHGFDKIDYVAIRDAATLGAPSSGPLRVLAAVHIGKTRLIDNISA